MKMGCKRRKKELSISADYMLEIMKLQDYKCPITGTKFTLENISEIGSIDRIDSSKGYVEGNIWFITQKVNMKKSNLTLEQLAEQQPEVIVGLTVFKNQVLGKNVDIIV